MNSLPRHVAKCTTGYQRLFPLSRLLLITTSTSHSLIQSTSQRVKDLEPALKILADLQPYEKVLLHSFSDGGATATWLLAKKHSARTGQALPISKAVFDSAPGSQDHASSLAAFSVALPKNPVLWAIGSGLLRVLLRVWFFYKYAAGSEHIVNTVRKGLNDVDLIPTLAVTLYVYNVADKLIQSQDIELHAQEAQAKGYKVQMVKYLDSGHAGHLLQDEKRYWAAVTGLWDSDYLSSPGSIVVAW